MTHPANKENEMKKGMSYNGEWLIHPSPSESTAGITTIFTGHDGNGNMIGQIAEVYGSDKDAQVIAKLMASSKKMFKMAKEIVDYVETNGIDKLPEEDKGDYFCYTLYKHFAKNLVAGVEGRREGIVS